MLSRPQQILLKRAQAQARIDDDDYRSAIETVSALPGCRSSKDPRLTDRHLDLLLAYFEAIYWRAVDAGQIGELGLADAVFRRRGFWASKNPAGNTSRDRHADGSMQAKVADLEGRLNQLGYGLQYLQTIQNRIRPFSVWAYRAALERTLRAKESKVGASNE